MSSKLKIIFLIGILLVLLSSICLARIPSSEVALGGIHIGDTKEYLLNYYGEPTKIETINGLEVITYGENLSFSLENNEVIAGQTFDSGTEITTPLGLQVGDTLAKARELYGKQTLYERDYLFKKDKLPHPAVIYSTNDLDQNRYSLQVHTLTLVLKPIQNENHDYQIIGMEISKVIRHN